MKKKALSLLLALTMCLTALTPAAALDTGDAPEQAAAQEQTVSEGQDAPASGEEEPASEEEEQPVSEEQEEQPVSEEREAPVSEEQEAPASEEQETQPTEEEPEQPAAAPAAEPALLAAANVPAVQAGTETTAGDESTLRSAVAQNGAVIKLTAAITLNSMLTISEDVSVTLDLNGQTITANFSGSAIQIANGASLTLNDGAADGGGTITHANGKTGRGVYVKGAGSNNTSAAAFTMNGGTISGNTASQTGNEEGGGVYVEGGLRTGMSGGTFTMNGGTITDNTAASGGGVHLSDYCTFTMTGGEITNNTASHSVVGNGGGVYVFRSNFTMTGGTISGNHANVLGGGISVSTLESYKFTMTGGEISGNSASDNGGGVFGGSPMTLSGSAKIINNKKGEAANNVCLANGYGRIAIGEEGLTAGASIGVTSRDELGTGESTAIVSSGATGDSMQYFTSDESYNLRRQGEKIMLVNGELAHAGHPICGDASCSSHGASVTSWTPIGTETELRNAAAGTAETPAYYYLTQDIRLTQGSWTPADCIVLDLNGYDVIQSGDTAVIELTGAFTLTDCKGLGGTFGKVTHAGEKAGNGVSMGSDGVFTMYGGAISGNTAGDNGGGVFMGSSSGDFTMYGGTISGNTGHGVFMSTSGLENKGTFTMHGGAVSGNTVDATNGGGVFVGSGRTFNLSGGDISGNNAAGKGGGVYIYNGSFTMTGGTITGNNAAENGGGVFVNGAFKVSGNVQIKDNVQGGTKAEGAAVYTGGTTNNAYLPNGKTVAIGGALSGKENSIGVTTETALADGGYVAVAKGADGYTLKNDMYYFSSDAGYEKKQADNSVLFVQGELHEHYLCDTSRGNKSFCSTVGGHSETDKEIFTPWTAADSLPDKTGKWYLTENVTLTAAWKPEDGTVLCLNSKTITYQGSGAVIDVSAAFTLVDCMGYHADTASFGAITHAEGASGRGVSVEGAGSFAMYGGSIANNNGGVNNEGTFKMYGGEIKSNTAAQNGGGVNNSGHFYLYNQGIKGNSAGGNGGGVHNTGDFTMTGRVYGNNAGGNGGGVCVSSGTFTVSGSAKVDSNVQGGKMGNGILYVGGTANNVYLPDRMTVTIGGEFYTGVSGASIGVTTATAPDAESPVQIAAGASNSENCAAVFTPDVTDQGFAITKDGDALYLSKHQHQWSYTPKSGATDTITAVCTNENCPLTDGTAGAYTIAPLGDNLTYDGTAKAAKVTFTLASDVTARPDGLPDPDSISISYTKDGKTITGKPTDAGDYTASFPLGEETASVEYTIVKAELKASDFSFTAPTGLTYTGEAQEIASPVSSAKTGVGTIHVFYLKDGTGTPTESVTGAGTYSVQISVEDGTNYSAADSLTDSGWTFSVAKAQQTITITKNTVTNNGVTVDVSGWAAVTGVGGDTNVGALSYALPDNTVSGVTLENNRLTVSTAVAAGENVFTIKVTAAETDNYNEKSENIAVTVTNKAAEALPGGVTQEDMIYNGGQAALPDPVYTAPGGSTETVTYAGTLRNGTGYAATAEKPTQAGAYTVTVTCETTDAIYTALAQFTIEPINLGDGNHGVGFSSPKITYAGEEDWTGIYPTGPNGAPQMKKDQDYRITGTTTAVNVGEYTVTIEGIGNNYTGKVSGTWEIIPAKLTVSGAAVASKTYDGTADAVITGVTFTGRKGSDALTLGTDYEVTGAKFNSPNAADADTVTFTVTLLDTTAAKNYELTSADCETAASITQAAAPAVQDGTLTVVNGLAREYTFDFKTLLPKLDGTKSYGGVTYGDLPGVQFDPGYYDFNATMSDGVLTLPILANSVTTTGHVGTVTVTVTTGNYREFALTLNVSAANQRVPTGEPVLSKTTLTYGDALSTIALSGTMKYNGADVPGTFAWADGTITPGAGTYQAGWKFTPDDGVYAEVTGTAGITIEKAVPTGKPAYTKITAAGKTLKAAGLTDEGGTFSVPGTVKWVDKNGNELADTTVVKANTEYQWKFFPTDAANYESIGGSIKLYSVSNSGGGGGGASAPTYPVSSSGTTSSAVTGGSVSASTKNASAGDTVTVTVSPEAGYRLGKLSVVDKNGKEIPVTLKDGKYTFTMPASQVEIKPVFEKISAETAETAFPDVPSSAYYAEPVKWAAEKGITSGTKDGGFAPGNTCTRAQIVTFLWRAAGSPEPQTTQTGMTDVSPEAYYAKAVAWAIENGITVGRSDGSFNPNGTCTRANGVTFLYRAAKAAASGNDAGFSDVTADAYYAAAVQWALENGITNGQSNGLFGPNGACTRAQIVTFLYRLYVKA